MNTGIKRRKMNLKKGKKAMIIVGSILVFAGAVLIYWGIPFSPNRRAFQKSMQKRVEMTAESAAVYTEEEIKKLPEAMQRYFYYIGCIGKKKHNIVDIKFKNVDFEMKDDGSQPVKIEYDLWLFADQPFRSACITSSMYGIPFEGIDYVTNEKEGGMKGIAGKAVPVFDTHNKQMYVAGLISWLIEGTLNPAILLSDYVSYEEIDAAHVKAVINYNGVSGRGTFTVDKEGRITSFMSMEREVSEINGIMTPIEWRGECGEYKEIDGILCPASMKASKIFPDGRRLDYFVSENYSVSYLK